MKRSGQMLDFLLTFRHNRDGEKEVSVPTHHNLLAGAGAMGHIAPALFHFGLSTEPHSGRSRLRSAGSVPFSVASGTLPVMLPDPGSIFLLCPGQIYLACFAGGTIASQQMAYRSGSGRHAVTAGAYHAHLKKNSSRTFHLQLLVDPFLRQDRRWTASRSPLDERLPPSLSH